MENPYKHKYHKDRSRRLAVILRNTDRWNGSYTGRHADEMPNIRTEVEVELCSVKRYIKQIQILRESAKKCQHLTITTKRGHDLSTILNERVHIFLSY